MLIVTRERTRGRVESDRWTAFRSHFSIESF